jgi:hypothetical protein
MHALVDSVFSKWRNALARYRRLVAAIEERERRVMRAILDTLSRLCDSEKRRRFRKLACRGCHVRRVALRSFTHWRAAAEAANWEAHKQSYKRGDGGARASDDDDSPSESPMRAALSAAPAHLDHLRALSTFGAIELHLGRLSTVRGLARRPITVDVAYHWLLEYGFRVYGAPLLPSGTLALQQPWRPTYMSAVHCRSMRSVAPLAAPRCDPTRPCTVDCMRSLRLGVAASVR